MKINNFPKVQSLYQSQQKKMEEQKARVQSDQMNISGKAKGLSELVKKLDQLPDVRAEKVAELKEKISEGNYQVDSKAIAKKIISRMRS